MLEYGVFGVLSGRTYKDAEWTYFEMLISGLEFGRYDTQWIGIFIYSGIFVVIMALLAYFSMRNCDISVTNQRVIGKANWGKRVDLPISQISAIGQGMFSSLTISTSSGRIRFRCLEKRNEVFNELSNLVKNYQISQGNTNSHEQTPVGGTSNADELKKYKELLDCGVISQEEFEAKKKQILGL